MVAPRLTGIDQFGEKLLRIYEGLMTVPRRTEFRSAHLNLNAQRIMQPKLFIEFDKASVVVVATPRDIQPRGTRCHTDVACLRINQRRGIHFNALALQLHGIRSEEHTSEL